MKRLFILTVFGAVLATGCEPETTVPVTIYTTSGEIDVAIDSVAAPITSANFLRYVRQGLYDGGSFFRVVRMDNQPTDSIRIEVIQGGANRDLEDRFFNPIELERTTDTGLMHFDGTISMARGGPNTATDSFFFTIGDQHALDFGGMRNPDGQGFAAFGRVTAGMDVVRVIQSGEVNAQILVNPVRIDSVRVN